jgi:hypothetical protein
MINKKILKSAALFAGTLAVCVEFAAAQVAVSETTTTTNAAGTITSITPGQSIVLNTGASPVTYRYSKTTQVVDDTGAAVDVSVLRSGIPATVYYVKEGNDMVVSRVVVKRSALGTSTTTTTTGTAPAAVEKREETTTTTTSSDDD